MRLIIKDNNYESDSLDDYVISLEDFGDKAFHPYIASHKWELVVLQVNDKTPKGIIKQLLPVAGVSVDVEDWNSLSVHQIQVLCEVFPDYAFRIKAAYGNGSDAVRQLIEAINRKV